MIGAIDLLSLFKTRLNEKLDVCRSVVEEFTELVSDYPAFGYLQAGDECLVDATTSASIDQFLDDNIFSNTTVDADGHVLHFEKYIFGAQQDAYILRKVDESNNIINVLSKTLDISGDYKYTFSGWDGQNGSFTDVFEEWANTITQNEIITKAIELAESNNLTLTNFTASFISRIDSLQADAKHVFDLICHAISNSSEAQRLGALISVIKNLFDGWNEAEVVDGRIYFNNTDFTVTSNFFIPWKVVTAVAGSILAAVAYVVHPVLGAIVSGVSMIVSEAVEAITENTSNEVKLNGDASRDNDCFAQPIIQVVYDLSLNKSYMTPILQEVQKYGRCKLVNGAFTTYCWVGDSTPYGDYNFSTLCIETYISMLSDLDELWGIPEQDYILTAIDNAISVDYTLDMSSLSQEYDTINYSMDAVGTVSGLNGLKTNLRAAYGTRTTTPTMSQPGNASNLEEFNGVTRNHRIARRLSRGLLLYIAGLHIAVRELYPTGDNQYCTGSYTDYPWSKAAGSAYFPFQNKDWNWNLETCKKIIAYWLSTFKQYNAAHTSSSYAISYATGWPIEFNVLYQVQDTGDLAVWFQGMCNSVIPAIKKRAEFMMKDTNIDWFDAVCWYLKAMPADPVNFAEATPNYINGASADTLIIGNISNACNAYVYPPHNTVSIWVRIGITAAAVAAVAITAVIISVKVKSTIARKATLKRQEVKAAYDKFLQTGSKADWQNYRKVNRQYKRFWGALSGVSYDAMNNWNEYSSSSGIDSEAANGFIQYFQDKVSSDFSDVQAADTAIQNSSNAINQKVTDTKTMVTGVANTQDDQGLLLLSIKNLIKP